MRKLAFLPVIISLFLCDAMAAVRPNARGGQASGSATATGAKPVSARAARTAPTTGGVGTAGVATTGAKTVNRGRVATTTPAKPTVAARAATKQKVISTGTKITSAAKNVTIDGDCQAKYDGCMDSFCMIDNANGGRCLCSDRNQELNTVLAEIEKLDQQSYQMATFGVEKIEMGMYANDAIAAANAAADAVLKKEEPVDTKKKARKALDLSAWDTPIDADDDEEDLFGAINASPVDGKEGDALHRAAAEICVAQIPECKSDISMLQMMYAQRIKSDCSAYENSLKQQKNASAQKLQTAERALREAALEQLQTANKYDLGQCTIKFKECMQTTGGCGDDFSSCAVMSAMDSTSTRKSTSKQAKSYQIKGAITNIEISASTYDMLMSKKPLCESVTRSCVAVADQVWDTFLKEVAPQVKSAELIAEDKARQDCIGNISACFQKACKDNMDPNDKDGSYDMCLSRPGTMLNVCKIPLNNCGIDASSEAKAAESNIWDFVVARLAAMRVNACTAEVKECLQSEDRCGEDYTQCIGLDTDSIIRMCPYDTLTGCQKVYGGDDIRGDAVYEELANMVQGIMLTIDNNFLTACQNAADEAMIKVCGDTTDCNALAIDDGVGSRTLEYKVCEYGLGEDGQTFQMKGCRANIDMIADAELGRVDGLSGTTSTDLGPVTPFSGVINGVIYWENVDVGDDGLLVFDAAYKTSIENDPQISEGDKKKIVSELENLQNSVNLAIKTIEADPTVQYCMTGREVQGMKTEVKGQNVKPGTRTRNKIGEKSEEAARFPELTKQMRMIIANAALKKAKDNYYKEYDKLYEGMMQDYVKIGTRLAEIQGENAKDVRREHGRVACINFAKASSLPKSPAPSGGVFGKVMAGVLLAAAIVAVPFTGGGSLVATASIAGGLATATTVSAVGVAALAAGVAAVGVGAASEGKIKQGDDAESQLQMMGSYQLNQWNYKETNTSTYKWDTLICQRCTRSQQCTSTKKPLFGSRYCKAWGDPVEKCNDIQF